MKFMLHKPVVFCLSLGILLNPHASESKSQSQADFAGDNCPTSRTSTQKVEPSQMRDSQSNETEQ